MTLSGRLLALEPGWSPSCHNPRRCIQPDPIRSIVCRKRGSHCRKRRGPEQGIFPKNLAESSDPRTNRQHRIEVAASNLLVTGSDLDLPEARSFQNAAHPVGVSERERTGRVRIVSGLRRQMSGRGPKRQDVERVLLQRPPPDEGEAPIRPEATTNVDERRKRGSEEHHPKPRQR